MAPSDQGFKFQPLPSTAQLNTLPPTTHYNGTNYAYLPPSVYDEDSRDDNPDIQHDQPKSQSRLTSSGFWTPSSLFKSVEAFVDAILSVAPVIFLVLAFAALRFDQHPISRGGDLVLQAARLGPTLFPIIFAAVVGRLMRTYALWRAERGAKLGVLEQLNGSQNLLAAIERAFMLRGLGFTSFMIVALWMLSPVGGQSSLRVLERAQAHSSDTRKVYYFNTSMDPDDSAFIGASSMDYSSPTMTAIYQASLLSLEQVGAQDLWRNVKIPYLEYLTTYRSGTTEDGFYKLDAGTPIYSSLTGIVVAGLSGGLVTNFSLESSYFNLSCDNPRFFSTDDNSTGSDFYGGFWDWAGNLGYHNNKSEALFADPRAAADDYTRSWNSFMVDTNWNYTGAAASPPAVLNLIYASQGADVEEVAAYNCTVGQSYVESRVSCDGQICTVVDMRPSLRQNPASNITPFTANGISLFANFLSWFPWATGSPHSAECAPTDFYIAGEDTPYQQYGKTTSYRNVSAQQVAQRLGNLVNTAWQTSLLGAATAQPPSTNVTALQAGTEGGTNYDSVNTTGRATSTTEVYSANKAWIGLTVLIAVVLLICGVAGMAFKYLSKAPDILGYVSSMTRDNPYFRGPAGGDHVDGLERARLLRHVEVQIADVKPWEERGHIALRSLGTEGTRLSRTGKNRTFG